MFDVEYCLLSPEALSFHQLNLVDTISMGFLSSNAIERVYFSVECTWFIIGRLNGVLFLS
jgi:hypothetical protein